MSASEEDSFENWDIFEKLSELGLDVTLDDPDLVEGDTVTFRKKEGDEQS